MFVYYQIVLVTWVHACLEPPQKTHTVFLLYIHTSMHFQNLPFASLIRSMTSPFTLRYLGERMNKHNIRSSWILFFYKRCKEYCYFISVTFLLKKCIINHSPLPAGFEQTIYLLQCAAILLLPSQRLIVTYRFIHTPDWLCFSCRFVRDYNDTRGMFYTGLLPITLYM